MSAKRTSGGTVAASRVASLLGVSPREVRRACERHVSGYTGRGMTIPALRVGSVYRVPRWWYDSARELVERPGSQAKRAGACV